MILKQHTQHSSKDYIPDGPFFKEQCHIWVEPLESAIKYQFIPALVGWEVSDAERQILALPLGHGELGLTDPQETAKTEYKHSTQITDKLIAKIYTQKLDINYNPSDQLYTRHTKKQTTTKECRNIRDEILEELTPES